MGLDTGVFVYIMKHIFQVRRPRPRLTFSPFCPIEFKVRESIYVLIIARCQSKPLFLFKQKINTQKGGSVSADRANLGRQNRINTGMCHFTTTTIVSFSAYPNNANHNSLPNQTTTNK